MQKETVINGITIAPGVVIDEVFLFAHEELEVPQYMVKAEEAEQEITAYHSALERVMQEMTSSLAELKGEESEIMNAHIMILNDSEIDSQIQDYIRMEQYNAAKAVDAAYREFAELMASMDDPYLKQRSSDIQDIRLLLLEQLLYRKRKDFKRMRGILGANELFPSDFKQLCREAVTGIVTEQDEATSHAAIIARSFDVPVIFGAKGISAMVQNGDLAALDGNQGTAILNPTAGTAAKYRNLQDADRKKKEIRNVYLRRNCQTKDGAKFAIEVNEGTMDVNYTDDCACSDGVGLFRTEFLYMESARLPDEETQFSAYREVLQGFRGKPVIIRTLDIGADKQLPYFSLPEEANPALGKRAIRYCLSNKELFRTQLRALLRASAYGDLWIMFPMISGVEDYRAAKKTVIAVQEELQREVPELQCRFKLGIMVEIPSAAMMADTLAHEVDFASIGTNDLTQYLEAVDRVGGSAGDYYRPFHPALMRMVHQVVQAFARERKPVGVCGELAGKPDGAVALASLGIRQLSMDRTSIAGVKCTIAQFETSELQALGDRLLQASSEEEVRSELEAAMAKKRTDLRMPIKGER